MDPRSNDGRNAVMVKKLALKNSDLGKDREVSGVAGQKDTNVKITLSKGTHVCILSWPSLILNYDLILFL